MLDLGKRMFPLLALALELEENFFDDKVSIPTPALRPRKWRKADMKLHRNLDSISCCDSASSLLPAIGRQEGQREAAWNRSKSFLSEQRIRLLR